MGYLKELALTYKRKMNMNVLPLKGKRPTIEWDKWQKEIQTEADIEKMDWDHSTGIGNVQGINDIRNLDLDDVQKFEIVELILNELGFPDNYSWAAESGSRKGNHIYLRIKENKELLEKLGGQKAVYKFKMKKEGYCKHIELRWMNCQTVLPPSQHESGGIYSFCFNDPTEPPVYVELEKVISCLEKYCEIESQNSKVKNQKENEHEQIKNKRNGNIGYDKARLESALEFLSENLPDGCYEEWYRIGFALVPLGEEGEKYFVEMSSEKSELPG